MRPHIASLFDTVLLKRFFVIFLVLACSGCALIKELRLPTTVLTNKTFIGAVLSPDGRTLVFALAEWGKESQLFKVNVDGTNLTPLTTGDTYDCEPAFSPDGSKIVYFQGSNGNGDLCIINLDGSGKHAITSGPENDFEPVWSADGTRVYFLRSPIFTNYSPLAAPAWHKIDVYSIKTDGSDLKRITNEAYYSLSSLSISSNTNSIMVWCWGAGERSVRIISLDNPSDKKFVRPDLEKYRERALFLREKIDHDRIYDPQFSPDGKHILFTYLGELYVMDLTTGVAKRIWKWESNDERARVRMNPKFSSDGQQIIFAAARVTKKYDFPGKPSWPGAKTEPELWIINKDGTPLQGKAGGPIFNSNVLK